MTNELCGGSRDAVGVALPRLDYNVAHVIQHGTCIALGHQEPLVSSSSAISS